MGRVGSGVTIDSGVRLGWGWQVGGDRWAWRVAGEATIVLPPSTGHLPPPDLFLDTPSHLYKRVCPSVCPSVRGFVSIKMRLVRVFP